MARCRPAGCASVSGVAQYAVASPATVTGNSSFRRTRLSTSCVSTSGKRSLGYITEARADQAMRPERAVQQVLRDLPLGRRLRGRGGQPKCRSHQLVGLQHAVPFGDRQLAADRSRTAARAWTACVLAQGWSFSTSSSSSMSRIDIGAFLADLRSSRLRSLGIGIGVPLHRLVAMLLHVGEIEAAGRASARRPAHASSIRTPTCRPICAWVRSPRR